MRKKLLALFLTIAMLLSILPTSVFAESISASQPSVFDAIWADGQPDSTVCESWYFETETAHPWTWNSSKARSDALNGVKGESAITLHFTLKSDTTFLYKGETSHNRAKLLLSVDGGAVSTVCSGASGSKQDQIALTAGSHTLVWKLQTSNTNAKNAYAYLSNFLFADMAKLTVYKDDCGINGQVRINKDGKNGGLISKQNKQGSVSVVKGTQVTLKADKDTSTDLDFDGWYLDADYTQPYPDTENYRNIEQTITMNDDLTLYAKFKVVTTFQTLLDDGTFNVYTPETNSWTYENNLLKSGGWHKNNAKSVLYVEFTAADNQMLSFDYLVSAEEDCDTLTVTLDGTKILNDISGNEGISAYNAAKLKNYSKVISAGSHKLVATYQKDESDNAGADCAWITNLVLGESVALTVNKTGVETGGTVSVNGKSVIAASATNGTASVLKGSVRLVAGEDDNAVFVGWYDAQGNLLSNDKSFAADITEACTIEARFVPKQRYNLTIDFGAGVTVKYNTSNSKWDRASAVTSGTPLSLLEGDYYIRATLTDPDSYIFGGMFEGQSPLNAVSEATPNFVYRVSVNKDTTVEIKAQPLELDRVINVYGDAEYSVIQDATYPWTPKVFNGQFIYLAPGNQGVGDSTSAFSIQIDVPEGQTYYFAYRYAISTEGNYDKVTMPNGEVLSGCGSISEEVGDLDMMRIIMPLAAGSHTLTWSYTKDGSRDQGADGIIMRDLELFAQQPQYTVSLTYDASQGEIKMNGETAPSSLNGGAGDSFTLTALPAEGYSFVGWYNGSTPVSTELTYIGTFGPYDTLSAVFDYSADAARDLTANADNISISTVDSVNHYRWSYSEQYSSEGYTAYIPGNSQLPATEKGNTVCNLKLTVTGPGVLSFDYYASSEANYDALIVSVGSRVSTSGGDRDMSGEVNMWQHKEVTVSGSEGQIIDIYLAYAKDVSGDKGDDLVAIANIGYSQGRTSLTVTSNQGGTVSAAVGDTQIAVNTPVELAVGTDVTLHAVPASGNQFYGWRNTSGRLLSVDRDYTFVLADSQTITAEFQTAGYYQAFDGEIFYRTLNDALTAASSVGRTIILLENVTVNEDLTVPAGVTLLIPYSGSDTTGYGLGNTGNAINRPSWTQESRFLYRTLTIAEGKTFTVNGSMIIGAVQHYPDQSSQAHTSGAYSQVICNGSMIVNGSLINYGLIKGSGTTTVKNGATMKTPFLVTSYSGGTNTDNLYSSGSFPFTQFATVNVQDTLIVEGGATVTGLTSLYFYSSVTTQDIALIGTSAGLILLPVGSTATLTYDASKRVNQTVGNIDLSDFGKTTVTISGGATAGLFDVSGYGSASMYLNIPYTYDIVLTNGTYTMSRQYRIMPGASVTVADGATLNVTGGLQVTDGWQQADKSGKLYPSTAELANNNFSKSGALIVNGTLNVTGTFGGIVQTTAPENATVMIGATAKVAENFTAGCTGGYTDDYVSYSLPARAWVDGNLTNLTAGTYYGKDSDAHTLESYTMAANRISGTTVTINQPMTGTLSQPGITFESNGGSAVAAINAAADSTISAPAAPTKEGYTFAGWYANADLSGDAYVFTTMPRVATVLYAKWTANTYTVSFDANGGEGTMTAQSFTYDEAAKALSDNVFSKTGYRFTGWNTAADGTGTAYTDKQSVQNLTAESGAEIKLYAQWSANTYTVTLDPNGGAFNAGVENTLTVTYGGTYGTIPTPRKNGYNFGGWYLGEEQITAASTVATASDHTLTAHWNEIADAKYTVYHYTEALNGKYSQYEKETFYGVPDTEVTAAALSIPGFTYFPGHEDGWATDKITADGRMVLEMYYSRNSYTLSYKDGDTSVLTADSYKFEEAVNPQSYSKDGYTFEGWFANAELTEAVPATMPANDVTLYAKFAAVSYTVSYISDGSEVHTESVACDAAIPAYTPEKTGYRFLGWYTDEALKNAAPATMPASDLSLYAAWEKNTYTVTVHHQYNGEQIHEDSTQSVAYLETVTDPVIELDGYYFTDGNITPAADTQITSDTEMTVSYNSYLADLLAIDSATFSDDAVLASARALYAKLNDQQKTEYTGTEHQAALFAAIKTYSEAQLKAAVSAAVVPTNAALADTSSSYIDETVATLIENNQNVDVTLLLPDYLAKNMLYVDFLTELFGYEEIKSIQINDLAPYTLTGTTVAQNPGGSDQFKLMFNIAWATLYPEYDEGAVMNLLRENEETLTNSALDGKNVTATVTAVTAEGVEYSVPYTITFAIPVEKTLKIASASLVLNGKIDIAFTAEIPDGYTDARMVFTGPNGEMTVTDYTMSGESYVFTYTGINPQCMGDSITATLYATKNGTEETVSVENYSVRQYCVNKLADETISASLRTLLSDMLAYGAAAQTYMDYKTDALVNAGEINNPTYSTFAALSGLSASFDGTAAADIYWAGAGLTLTNSVAMTFRFYAASVDGLTVKVTVNGTTQEFTQFTAVAEGVYEIAVTGISADEFGDTVSASFYSGETQVGNTVSYSVSTYVQAKQADSNANLAALVKALYNYGASAKAFAN